MFICEKMTPSCWRDSQKLEEGPHAIVHNGRKVIFAITKQNVPSKCINQWEPIQANCGDGGWGSVVHLPNASQGQGMPTLHAKMDQDHFSWQ